MALVKNIQHGLGMVGSAVDQLVGNVHIRRNLRGAATRLGNDEEWPDLSALTAEYDRPEHFTNPRSFFSEPPAPVAELTEVRPLGIEGRVWDARWASCGPFSSSAPAPLGSNQAAARLFLHREPARAAVIFVHGYLGGRYLVEERLWPVRRLFDRGIDVALATLPFHGVRKAPGMGGSPGFPSADPRATNEGIRQAVFDLRGLMRLFHARGTPRVGAMGMSLGGYTAALLATLEPKLAFAVPVVPLADLTEFARGNVPDPASIAAVQQSHPERMRVHRVISPLARPSLLPKERVLVIGAAADRIAPPSHALALADHFEAPLEMMPGSHLFMFGRGRPFEAAERIVVACRDTEESVRN